jgi:hypothetical protein
MATAAQRRKVRALQREIREMMTRLESPAMEDTPEAMLLRCAQEEDAALFAGIRSEWFVREEWIESAINNVACDDELNSALQAAAASASETGSEP